MTHRDFRLFLNKCDEAGMVACINRTGKGKARRYQVVINMNLIKTYRQRSSAKKLILKTYNELKK